MPVVMYPIDCLVELHHQLFVVDISITGFSELEDVIEEIVVNNVVAKASLSYIPAYCLSRMRDMRRVSNVKKSIITSRGMTLESFSFSGATMPEAS